MSVSILSRIISLVVKRRARQIESVLENEQVIAVTHMEELKESADRVISLTPQGKGR
ncbi:MAG: hypothetical protein ACW98J_07265 [Candidatus Thorarchaeota archaeon]|jgi:DNA repair exonuclease SbcCD ATPase subunit